MKEYDETYNYTYNPCSAFNEPPDPHAARSFGGDCHHVAVSIVDIIPLTPCIQGHLEVTTILL